MNDLSALDPPRALPSFVVLAFRVPTRPFLLLTMILSPPNPSKSSAFANLLALTKVVKNKVDILLG